MSKDKKILKIHEAIDQDKLKKFNKMLKDIADEMPEGCALIFIEGELPASYVIKGAKTNHVTGELFKIMTDMSIKTGVGNETNPTH